jgi:RNA polymerase sigma-70 factor (ECF subfamily)
MGWPSMVASTPPGPAELPLSAGAITRVLREAHEGDRSAFDRLLPLLYADLRQLAQNLLLFERRGHTLQATALVHEMWLKLAAQESLGFDHRRGFFSAAATAMRRILVDHARGRTRQKRGEGVEPAALDESVAALERSAGDLVALDEALGGLAELDARKAKLVELRFFVGLSTREAAELLAISERQAERDLALARAWLRDRLDAPGGAP